MTTLGDTPNALPVGARLHEFEVERILGEGGFAIVYLAFDHSLHRRIALKEYLPAEYAFRHDTLAISIRSPGHRATFDAGLRSFIEEARFLAQFEHPSLVKVHRVLEANGTAYMAQGYYAGVTLREMLKSNPAFATQTALKSLTVPLLEAVELLHSRQCVHRDIAPDNIIVQPSGVPVLLDFGAARRIIGDMSQALTAVLKPSYAPIEQYTEEAGLAQGAWTDVYALAAMLRAAITGKPPPAAPGRALNDTLVPFHRSPPAGYDLRFLNGVDAGLAVLPRDRPQSIAAFRDALGLVAGVGRNGIVTIVQSTGYAPATARTTDFAPTPDLIVPPMPVVAPAPGPVPAAMSGSSSPDSASLSLSETPNAAASRWPDSAPAVDRSAEASGAAGATSSGIAFGDDAAAAQAGANPRNGDEAASVPMTLESRAASANERDSIDAAKRPRATRAVAPAAARSRWWLLPLALSMVAVAIALYMSNFSGKEDLPTTARRDPPPGVAKPAVPKATSAGAVVAGESGGVAGDMRSKPDSSDSAPRATAPATTITPPPTASAPAVKSSATAAPTPNASANAAGGGSPRMPESAPASASVPSAPATAPPAAARAAPPRTPSTPAVAAGADAGTARAAQPSKRDVLAGSAAAGAAIFQAPPTEAARIASVPPDSTAPKRPAAHSMIRISGADPEYPREAIRSGVTSGRVLARVHVDERGNVVDVEVKTASPPRVFDRAARAALQGWKFQADGEKYQGDVEINFKLKDE